MIRVARVTVGITMMLMLAGGARALAAPRAIAYSPPTCFDIPLVDSCFVRVHQHARGALEGHLIRNYSCGRTTIQLMKSQLRLVLQREPRCDELGALLPSGSVLSATVSFRRRADEFGHLIGSFQLMSPSQQPLYTGTIELMERVGSHHEPFGPNGQACEPCDRKGHLEGWLFGCGIGHQYGTRIRANVTLNRDVDKPNSNLTGSIDGLLLRP
ncbi:MAG TPA: hypothetical protein VFK69_09480 [Candidatus Eisenbacteria bacterium]|nr:hypothetical protein [Candidatus Eisenbacteria bacterium]